MISKNSRNFQSRYHFRLDSLLPSFISTQTVSLFPGVVYVISDLSKKFSINFSTSSLNSSFFLPELLSTAIRRFNFFARVPTNSTFFCGLNGSDLSVLWALQFKICFIENVDDVVGVVFEVDVSLLTCNCFDIVFLDGIPWNWQFLSSWTLCTPLALDIFFFLFQFFFLRHRWPYTDHTFFGHKRHSNLCLFFVYHFQ